MDSEFEYHCINCGNKITKDESELIEGIVTAVRRDDDDRLVLELDTGDQLRLSDLVQAA